MRELCDMNHEVMGLMRKSSVDVFDDSEENSVITGFMKCFKEEFHGKVIIVDNNDPSELEHMTKLIEKLVQEKLSDDNSHHLNNIQTQVE